jgi:hypothetical protein
MGERADRLATEIKRDTLTGIARALADEAVLIVERLEILDATLQGDPAAWLGITMRMPAEVAEVTVNAPLAEARQQATALKGLLAELAKTLGVEPAVPVANVADEVKVARDNRRKAAGLL